MYPDCFHSISCPFDIFCLHTRKCNTIMVIDYPNGLLQCVALLLCQGSHTANCNTEVLNKKREDLWSSSQNLHRYRTISSDMQRLGLWVHMNWCTLGMVPSHTGRHEGIFILVAQDSSDTYLENVMIACAYGGEGEALQITSMPRLIVFSISRASCSASSIREPTSL